MKLCYNLHNMCRVSGFWINHFTICLTPRAGKMNRISRCDWLPERARWSYIARSGCGLCPASTQITIWCFIPYNKSFIDQACSVKMAGYWPFLFLRVYGPRLRLGPYKGPVISYRLGGAEYFCCYIVEIT